MTTPLESPPALIKNLSRTLWLPLLVFLIGCFYAYRVNTLNKEHEQHSIQTALNTRLELIRQGVRDRVFLFQYGLRGLRGSVLSHGLEQFDYVTMQKYSASRNNEVEFSGARGIGFIRRVAVEQRSEFLLQAKHDRPDKTFNIRQLSAHDGALFVIQYIEPEDKNRQAVGLDIASESTRKKAALDAVIHNEVQLTAPITLVQADHRVKHGFLILLPIYQTPVAPQTKAQRLAQFVGWSYAPLLIEDVLDSLPGLGEVSLTITDITSQEAVEFFTYGNFNATNNQMSKTLDLFGRQWQLALSADSAFIDDMRLSLANQAIKDVLSIISVTVFLMLLIFSVQMAIMRRTQYAQSKAAIAKAQENALAQANMLLEKEVQQRTAEMAKMNMLQRSILTGASYAIIATDENGLITVFNPAAEKLLGYRAQDMIGQQTPALFHLEQEIVERTLAVCAELKIDIEPSFETFVAKAKQGLPDVNQWTYVDSQGNHIPVRLSVTALVDEHFGSVGYLGIAFNLTEQLEHERMLAQAKELAEKGTKAKSEFLANMSHEIRTPMNGLYGTLQLLKEQPLNAQGVNFLEKAIYSTKSLTTIINDILDFSKIEAGKLSLEHKVFKLSEVIEFLHSDLLLSAREKGITLTIDVQIEQDYWYGDPTRLRQIFLNILSNAIKFTQQGSVRVKLKPLTDNEGVSFIVSDTGIGMSEEALMRLFNRFEQADTSTTRKYGGTGLGLSITQSLVHLMSGTIKVESTEGKGTVFSVEIPLEKATQQDFLPIMEALDYPDMTQQTILVAEDNQINQLVIEALLAPTKATLVIVENGKKAVEYCVEHRPSLIFMDIQMPEMDGMEACKIIKAMAPEQLIIALTANVFMEDKIEYAKIFDGFLAKPIEKSALLHILHTAMDKSIKG